MGEPENKRQREAMRAPPSSGCAAACRAASVPTTASGERTTYTSKIVRATLTFDGDDRPLVIDFPDTPLARELLKAAKDAIALAG